MVQEEGQAERTPSRFTIPGASSVAPNIQKNSQQWVNVTQISPTPILTYELAGQCRYVVVIVIQVCDLKVLVPVGRVQEISRPCIMDKVQLSQRSELGSVI